MTVSLRDLKADIKVAEDSTDKSEVNPIYFCDESGELLPVGDVIWDDDNDCWIICQGEDDDD